MPTTGFLVGVWIYVSSYTGASPLKIFLGTTPQASDFEAEVSASGIQLVFGRDGPLYFTEGGNYNLSFFLYQTF